MYEQIRITNVFKEKLKYSYENKEDVELYLNAIVNADMEG